MSETRPPQNGFTEHVDALDFLVFKQLRDHFGEKLFNTVIAVNVSLREAASHGRPITEHNPRSRGFRNHVQLSKEMMGVSIDDADRRTAVASGGKRWKN